jgi:hypothetical protein
MAEHIQMAEHLGTIVLFPKKSRATLLKRAVLLYSEE